MERSSEISSVDVVSEDIARSLYLVFRRYAGRYDWMIEDSDADTLWEDLEPDRKVLFVAVVKKLLILEKIEPGSNVIITEG
jgi:hypothetical protein